ncbi:MAG: glutamate-5-semialdehyde dehydrogenase [Neomegalonema sp.]|nr:glutamate-5-semialdehyde dehydrogenase [Neomegalonema sp.]
MTTMTETIAEMMRRFGEQAKAAAQTVARASAERKHAALIGAAEALWTRREEIFAANAADVADAKEKGLSAAMVDRLVLDEPRLRGVANSLRAIAEQADPIGAELAAWEQPNGLKIRRVRIPIGVIGVIFESRPNVVADAGALCLKAGNAAILRAGSESLRSAMAIHAALVDGLKSADLPEAAIQLAPTKDRAVVGEMLENMGAYIDVIVPRGGRSLVERVQSTARVPVFAHLEGVCHIYVDKAADLDKARKIILNAKMRRTGICGAAECLLFDKAAPEFIEPIVRDLIEAGCEVRGDAAVQAADARVKPATADDYGHEYLDAIIAAKVVDGVSGAISHITEFGSSHTEAILTEDDATATAFFAQVDSAIVMHNASTQFADGGEFGMGAEIGIATGRLHARGPVGAEQLTSFKYLVEGDGAVRS